MSQPQVSLFIDVQNRTLVRSFTSTVPTSLPLAYQGDTLNLALRFMQATGVSSAPYTDIDYSAASVTVSVGASQAKPTVGTFSITDTDADQTTSGLQYNATAAQMQAAIQSALITNWINPTVYGGTGGPFTLTNGINGAVAPLIGTSLTLEPASSVAITELQVGTDSLPEIQYLQLSVNPIALQDSWTATHSPEILSGTLSLATASIEALMGNAPSICGVFSIKVVPVSGEPFTVIQNSYLIKNDSILGAPSIPTPGVSYYTAAQSDARYAGNSVAVQRDATGGADLHVITSQSPTSNVLFLLTNAASAITFAFDNGTFDGQTITYRVDRSIASITYSDNVAGVLSPDYINGVGASLSFIWDATNSVWTPI